MIELVTVKNLPDLQRLMPLFLEGFAAMNRRNKAFDCDQEGFIKTLVGVVGSMEDDVVAVAYDDDTPVGYGVAFEDTPPYCNDRQLLLWALYVKPDWSRRVGPIIFDGACAFAKDRGYASVKARNGRLNGSSLKFFEKVLKMSRSVIEFTKTIS